MSLNNVRFCRPIPDDDPLFSGVPLGGALEMDGVLYVRLGDWSAFVESISMASTSLNESGSSGSPPGRFA